MRIHVLLSATLALAAACHQPQQPSAAPAPARADSTHAVATAIGAISLGRPRQDIEGFVAAIAASDSAGVCGTLPSAAVAPGEWVATLSFPAGSSAARKVTVHYDTTGALTYYQDYRGDLRPSHVVRAPDGSMRIETPPGRRTEIDLNLINGVGIARNTGGDGPEEAFMSNPAQMLDAPNLGYPRRMAAFVRERCPTS